MAAPVVTTARWVEPLTGYARLDVDTSFSVEANVYGAGYVLRNSTGVILFAGSWPNVKAQSVGQAELKAIGIGLQLVQDIGLNQIVVYSDAQCEVSKLNSSVILINEDGFLVEEITQQCRCLNVLSIRYMSRSCNTVTHALARHALSISSPCIWSALDGFLSLIQTALADVPIY
ncbi:hypothetical protein UlMin_013892 [Ulmus minor]